VVGKNVRFQCILWVVRNRTKLTGGARHTFRPAAKHACPSAQERASFPVLGEGLATVIVFGDERAAVLEMMRDLTTPLGGYIFD
jgi:hypothetical protein